MAEGSGLQISMDQLTGADYPFVAPKENVEFLVVDFLLVYREDECEFTPPFRLAELNGFGAGLVTKKVVVVDSADEVVFTSTGKTLAHAAWGADKHVYEWADTDTGALCRLIVLTDWSPRQPAYSWPDTFEPAAAQLDPRTLMRRNDAIDKIIIETADGDYTIEDGDSLELAEGYNMELSATADESVDGAERATEFLLECVPGSGAGKAPGCDPTEVLRRLNNQTPSETGDIPLTTPQCFRQELVIEAEDGLNLTVQPGVIRLAGGCPPCATCDQFVRVYQALRRLYLFYKSLGRRMEDLRDRLGRIVGRWNTSATCRTSSALRLTVIPMAGCRIAVGAGICNNGSEPLRDVSIKLTATGDVGLTPCLVCRTVFRRGNHDITSKIPPSQLLPYRLIPDGDGYRADFECIDPGGMGEVYLQFAVAGGTDGAETCVTAEVTGIDGVAPVERCAALNCTTSYDAQCCEALAEPTTPEP